MIRFVAASCVLVFLGVPFCLAFIAAVGSEGYQTIQQDRVAVEYLSPVTDQQAEAVLQTLAAPALLGAVDGDFKLELSRQGPVFLLRSRVADGAKECIAELSSFHRVLATVLSQHALQSLPVVVEAVMDGETLASDEADSSLGRVSFRNRYLVFRGEGVTIEEADHIEELFIQCGAIDPATCHPGLLLYLSQTEGVLVVGLKGDRQKLGAIEPRELEAIGIEMAKHLSLEAWDGAAAQFCYTETDGTPMPGLAWKWQLADGTESSLSVDHVKVFHDSTVDAALCEQVAKKMASISTGPTMLRVHRDEGAFEIAMVVGEAYLSPSEKAEGMLKVLGAELLHSLPANSTLTLSAANDRFDHQWSVPIQQPSAASLEFENGRIYYYEGIDQAQAETLAQYLAEARFNYPGATWEFHYYLHDGCNWVQMVVTPEGLDDELRGVLGVQAEHLLGLFGDNPALFELIDSNNELVDQLRWTNKDPEMATPES